MCNNELKKFHCVCGSVVNSTGKNKHYKTKKHIDYINNVKPWLKGIKDLSKKTINKRQYEATKIFNEHKNSNGKLYKFNDVQKFLYKYILDLNNVLNYHDDEKPFPEKLHKEIKTRFLKDFKKLSSENKEDLKEFKKAFKNFDINKKGFIYGQIYDLRCEMKIKIDIHIVNNPPKKYK